MTTTIGTTPRGAVSAEARRAAARAGARRRHPSEQARPPASRSASARITARRPSVALVLVLTVAVLNIVGLMMVLSASTVVAIEAFGTPWRVFLRQSAWAVLGVIVFVAMARVPQRQLQRFAAPVLSVSVVLLTVVLFMPAVDGARRWIPLGQFSFQPSELAKLALVLFSASVVARRCKPGVSWRYVAAPAICWLLICAALVMLEPDLDTTIELGAAVFAVLLIGGMPWRAVAGLAAVSFGAVAVLALSASYRFERVTAFMNPTANLDSGGLQSYQSLVALGSGGIDGVGLGAGRAKWGALPNVHTDFIYANVGEELGLVGSLLVLGLFVSLAACGFVIALRALRAGEAHRFGAFCATGITTWLTVQSAINLAMVTQLAPVSGTPLPFLSTGGSSLVLCMGAVGVLLNVATSLPAPTPATRPAQPPRSGGRRAPRPRPTPSPSRRRPRANLAG